jgi:predicted Fe-Mo cluster-binding NifX family protein
MRICIPTETNNGKNAMVCQHFGSAPFFTIYDSEKNSIEIIDNVQHNHVHGACQPMMALTGKKIDAVITGGMGPRAIQKLNEAGIKTFRANEGNVDEIIKKVIDNKLQELTLNNACDHHSCT